MANHSLAAIGYQEYSRRLALDYGDPLPAGVVLVAATAHYSWEKIVRALGIGSNQLVYIPLDTRFRMDPDALWERVAELARHRQPILACISVCGTTEESAVDRLDQVLEIRDRAERELGVTFHVHSDACYGGYAAALTRKADGTRRSAAEIRAGPGAIGPTTRWVRIDSGTGPGRLRLHRSPQDGVCAVLRRRNPGPRRPLPASRRHRPSISLAPGRGRAGHGALPRPVYPRRIKAGRRGGGGLAQPQGAAAQ